MNYAKKILSSANDLSFGRIIALLCLLYVMTLCAYVVYKMNVPTFPVIDLFWRDLILGLYGITKTGEVVKSIKKGGEGENV